MNISSISASTGEKMSENFTVHSMKLLKGRNSAGSWSVGSKIKLDV